MTNSHKQLTGKALIKSELPVVPELPGVYRMLDQNGAILYIGKAKNLANRLRQYTLELNAKGEKMISLTHAIAYVVCKSEAAALLLEGEQIKKHKPKFNILLKDDKSFPYIKLRSDHEFPQILKYRGKDFKGGKFFGPFASVTKLNTTMVEMQKIFQLRSCTDSYFASRQRPCMLYDIRRCSAPCTGKVSKAEYQQQVEQLKAFFAGKNRQLQTELSEKMQELSNDMAYEQAAIIRDRLKALSYIQMNSASGGTVYNDTDFLALSSERGEYCIHVFIYRANQLCGDRAYFFSHTSDSKPAEVMQEFLLQFYQQKEPPQEILASTLPEESSEIIMLLKELHNKKLSITMPSRGPKVEMMKSCELNSKISLQNKLKKNAKNIAMLSAAGELFDLPQMPRRIEIYDNSHIQGADAVGAMVVAGPEGFEKREYRLYNIKNAASTNKHSHGGDDYAMLTEVLTRRLNRMTPEKPVDLMIIDGGKGHMNTVKELFAKKNVDIAFVCMAKGKERNAGRESFYQVGKEPFTLDKNLPLMKYLQILRDEVHNFVINSHRRKRSGKIKLSSLDQIPNIGKVKKQALLAYFGSAEAVKGATPEELAMVEGVSLKLGQEIQKNLNNG